MWLRTSPTEHEGRGDYDDFRELSQLKDVVTTISNRDHTARFFLDDADIQAVATCTDSIRAIYDMIEVGSFLISGLIRADGVAGQARHRQSSGYSGS